MVFREPVDLELSEAQREIFAGWKRPSEFFGISSANGDGGFLVSMKAVNEIDLVQDITTDCSVVASLCAGTARALKGHGQVNSTFIPDSSSLNLPRPFRLPFSLMKSLIYSLGDPKMENTYFV